MGAVERGTINPYKFYEMRKSYSNKEIARITGYTDSGLSRWCKRNGVETHRITDSDIVEEIKTKSVKEVAFEYNVKADVIYYRLKKMGLNKKALRGIK